MSGPQTIHLVLLSHVSSHFALPANEVISGSLAAADEGAHSPCLLSLFGLMPSANKPLHRLSLRADPSLSFVFPGQLHLIEIQTNQLHPLPALMQARSCTPLLRALVEHEGAVLALLSARRLAEQLQSL